MGPDGSAQALRADHDVTMPRAGFYSLRDAAGKLQPIDVACGERLEITDK